MPFQDRAEAARLLTARLEKYRGTHPLILAIPRGAVPIAAYLASQLGGDLDLALVHKLGAPGHEEYAIGAVDERGQVFLNPEIPPEALPPGYLEEEVQRQLRELKERRRKYVGNRAPVDPQGRSVLMVDDGVATGSTMSVALRGLRSFHPQKLVAVTPVAPPEAVKKLQKVADEVVVLEMPSHFMAVGQFYQDFSQVSDEEVLEALKMNPGEGAHDRSQ